MRLMLFIATLFLAWSAFAEEAVPSKPVKVGLTVFKEKGLTYLAVNYENFPKWHTYWKNPGDAGLPIKNIFSFNKKEISLSPLEWPTPKRFIEPGDMWAYGYEGKYSLIYLIKNDVAKKINNKEISLKSTWLVCKHICVPGQIEAPFVISNDQLGKVSNEFELDIPVAEIQERKNNLPILQKWPSNMTMELFKGKNSNTLILEYTFKTSIKKESIFDHNLLFMFPQLPFDVKHEQLIQEIDGLKAQVEILWDGEYQDPPEILSANGKFKKPYLLKFLFTDLETKKSFIIEKEFKGFNLNERSIISQTLPNNSSKPELNSFEVKKIVQVSNPTNSLSYYLILAFIGGLILNIMPCVLPVISIKLFGLVKYRNESHKKVLKHNFFYTIGILFTFFTLASIILILKKLGSEVGWGFQLQSPNFISVMIIGLFVFSLNLFGVFEFSTPMGSKIGNVQTEDNFFGDFMSGILATVLSTPCSAPFLGTALTFAFTSSAFEIYFIFTMIGLGLAFPFILTAIYPKLVAFIPKPGNWMNTVKKLLGVALLLTVLWLFDVYNALVDGQSHLIKLATSLVFIYGAFLLHKKREKWLSISSIVLSLILVANLMSSAIVQSSSQESALIKDKQSSGLNWQAWSEIKMNEHQANKEWVFIDFTAKWCFTCKVNERLVLDTSSFKSLVQEKNLKLLIGDWTKRDEIIGNFLKKNGMVGVPAYFIQKPDGTLIKLGETISIDQIRSQIN